MVEDTIWRCTLSSVQLMSFAFSVDEKDDYVYSHIILMFKDANDIFDRKIIDTNFIPTRLIEPLLDFFKEAKLTYGTLLLFGLDHEDWVQLNYKTDQEARTMYLKTPLSTLPESQQTLLKELFKDFSTQYGITSMHKGCSPR